MATTDQTRALRDNAPLLYGNALRLTGNRDVAMDLVQDTFERCLSRIPPQFPAKDVPRWLLVVMRHLFIDRMRVSRCTVSIDICCLPAAAPPTGDDPDEPRWLKVKLVEAREVIESLPDYLRQPFEMHVFGRLSYRDIAVQLGIRPLTVGTRIFRARQQLRRSLLSDPYARAA